MRATLAALLATVLLTACSGGEQSAADSRRPGNGSEAGSRPGGDQVTSVEFAPPAKAGKQPAGITYNTALVPPGASASVNASSSGSTTTVTLDVRKLAPNHEFGAHVHTKPCGAKPADSGPHYQNRKDPASPSVDPAYANAQNEVWLDFVTDSKGAGKATATVNWKFRKGEAHSVVIHAQPTSTHPGHAGTAGDRLACITVAGF